MSSAYVSSLSGLPKEDTEGKEGGKGPLNYGKACSRFSFPGVLQTWGWNSFREGPSSSFLSLFSSFFLFSVLASFVFFNLFEGPPQSLGLKPFGM